MDKSDKLRILYIAKILYEQTDEEHFLTTNQICEILESEYGIKTHRQTIKSEIELLMQFGMDIQEIRSTQNKYNLLDRKFEISELKLLMDAVLASKFVSKEHSLELVKKISSLGGKYSSIKLNRNISCENRIKSDNKKVYLFIDIINEAINAKKKIAFQYFKYDAEKNQVLRNNGDKGDKYEITPLHLVWNGDRYYMVGVYDYDQRLGTFRIDRIANTPEILDVEATEPPKNFDINEYINSPFNKKRKEVILECDNGVMDSIIDRFGKTVEVLENKENTFYIKVLVSLDNVFYSWIFGFGGKVRIVEPSFAVMNYENMLNDALKMVKSNQKNDTDDEIF